MVCSHDEVVQIGWRTVHDLFAARRLIDDDCWEMQYTADYRSTPRCWADDEITPEHDLGCVYPPTTTLGLCAYHFDQIVPQEATP